jgi:hypothetical protein
MVNLSYPKFRWPHPLCNVYWAMEESTSFTTSIHIASFAVFRYVSVCLLRARKHINIINICIHNIPNWNDQFHKSEKFDPEIASPTVCSGPSLGDYLSHDIMDDFAHLWNLHFFELSRCQNGDVWRVLAAMLVARQAWRTRKNFYKFSIFKNKIRLYKKCGLIKC